MVTSTWGVVEVNMSTPVRSSLLSLIGLCGVIGAFASCSLLTDFGLPAVDEDQIGTVLLDPDFDSVGLDGGQSDPLDADPALDQGVAQDGPVDYECAETRDCDDSNPCTEDLCLDGFCVSSTAPDGTDCGSGRVCFEGTCGTRDPCADVVCSEVDQRCVDGICVPTASDDDGDGFTALSDCDDSDATVFPGAPEVCDGRDDDCDGVVDNDLAPLPCTASCGSGTETCWGGTWRCDAPTVGECLPGAVETTSCDCGTRTRSCSSTCSWGARSACSAEACADGWTCTAGLCVDESLTEPGCTTCRGCDEGETCCEIPIGRFSLPICVSDIVALMASIPGIADDIDEICCLDD